jgi:methylenetetrahydrofolate dehydrogenase (NADP+)/methenyltetrahydrofolate cyclohydrolase
MAKVISGKEISHLVKQDLQREIATLQSEHRLNPCLAVILVGDNPASEVYVRNKKRTCAELGIASRAHDLPATTSQEELLSLIQELNEDPSVHGILCQFPLPEGLNEEQAILSIAPEKDVDGLHPLNAGYLASGEPRFISCTPYGVLEMLKRAEIQTSGKNVVVVGRSNLVGRPLATLLSQKGYDATVTICHSRTRHLEAHLQGADVVIAAVGRAEFITGDMLREGTVVIDVGINRLPPAEGATKGKLVGDVHYASAERKASYITPVPGGVGPMTIAMLMKNTVDAARTQNGLARLPR